VNHLTLKQRKIINGIYKYSDGDVKLISGGFDWIDEYGLIKGQNNYFVALKDWKWHLFKEEDGKIYKTITECDYIETKYNFEGNICYICRKNDKYVILEYNGIKLSKILDETRGYSHPHNLILYGTSGDRENLQSNGICSRNYRR